MKGIEVGKAIKAILEDIDGVDWLICLFFSLLGIINSVKSQEMIGWKT